jgi:hypothetical protein
MTRSKKLGRPRLRSIRHLHWIVGIPLLFDLGIAVRANCGQLRPASSFAGIQDRTVRSQTLFLETAKVIIHPRCVNCHPAGGQPSQGDDHHIHQPSVLRGNAGAGIPGLSCSACHSDRNVDVVPGGSYQSIPGHPSWELAPIEMAWDGKTVAQICEQLKDPKA